MIKSTKPLNTNVEMFRQAIDSCRSELTKQKVIDEFSYRYAIIRVYSRVLLTACEIYTLIVAGYPEGALSLSRNVYEAMIIINKLIDGKQKNDNDMLERFLISPKLIRFQESINEAEWILLKTPGDAEAKRILAKLQKDFDDLKNQYSIKANRKNLHYWWAGCNTFTDLNNNTNHEKDPIYTRTCANVHFNAFSTFDYIDNSQSGILIGETEKGIVLPILYSSLCLFEITRLIHDEYPGMVSQHSLIAFKNVADCATKINKRKCQK